MDKQLEIIKADGTSEPYLHTKVLGAINNALAGAGRPDMAMAEDLSEVVTFHLYQDADRRGISSGEILAIVKAVLAATGCEEAAAALAEHALERRLRRSRTEVLAVNVRDFTDVQQLCQADRPPGRMPWNKGQIVHDLMTRSGLPRQMARAIASTVEERAFRMEMTAVPLSLLRQLVLGETVAALQAERELQTA